MAKLPSIKRILREDLKEAPSWVERLIYPLNLFIEQIYSALNKNITFQDNIAAAFKELTFTTKATYSSNDWESISFQSGLRTKVSGVVLLQITPLDGTYSAIFSAAQVSWYESQGTIIINYVSGLENSTKYQIKLLII